MKKLITTIFSLCFILSTGIAQTLPTNTTTSFMVNGLKVIFKPTVKDVISVRMYFRGGVYNYPGSMAGIESLALKAATECGTKKYNADKFRDLADEFGVSIGGSSTYDFGNIGIDCVSKYFNQSWDLFAEAINNPVFDNAEVQLLKTKQITAINGQQSDPDQHLDNLQVQTAFEGTPYATDPDGTAQSLSALSSTDLKEYYYNLLNKNRMFIVVAGNISRQQIEEKIKATFASLPSKPYTPPVRQAPVWKENKVYVESRALATNYISAAFNAPPVNSPEFLAYRMGISAFGGTLFNELRTKLNLSYDPGAYAVSQLMSYGIIHVSTNSPKEAITATDRTLSRLKALGISDEGLKYLKGSFITSNYIKEQGSGAITANLGSAEINGGWEYADKLPQMINAITVDQINAAMLKYIGGLRWTYIGDPELAKKAEDAFSTQVH
jgi:zinc protease